LPEAFNGPIGHCKAKSLQEVQAIIDEQQAETTPPLTVERLQHILPYPLDDFQAEAVAECLAGHSVVVCAPTGAGKTAIAIQAAMAALAQGCQVIYTTPLKALSNQKLRELQACCFSV
jgi:superfamily II RNA helicase